LQPEADQIPGVCFDYFTVQNWVDFSNEQLGVTIATPDNPMVQLGDFHFAQNQYEFDLERPMLLGWVTNNYWETNFRAHQPGAVTARYRIQPRDGGFDEAFAHRFGIEALYDAPIVQHLGESKASSLWPATAKLLELPQPPVIVLHVKPAVHGRALAVRLQNASDEQQTARIGSGQLRITDAVTCDLLEHATGALGVREGAVEVTIPPRGIAVVRLEVSAENS
jgi:alpha-mannosidase